ncbi:Z1 domain-containing protein [Gulosibacter macacae]|nr:Z1 domain-containing protein [Gulosibacter macacae]
MYDEYSEYVDKVDALVSTYLQQEAVSEAELREKVPKFFDLVKSVSPGIKVPPDGSADQNDLVREMTARLLERFRITLDQGNAVVADFKPWLDERWDSQKWPHYAAYRSMLISGGRPPAVIRTLERDVKQIMDLVGDPTVEGAWRRRGLIIGDVQSGKTGTYLALLNMAIDAGYKMLVIIGGHTEDLRRQTQIRADEGLLGQDSRGRLDGTLGNITRTRIGVGKVDPSLQLPNSFTTVDEDFSRFSARTLNVDLETALTGGIVLVVKKNATVLRTLRQWIKQQTKGDERTSMQMLVIDDESDYASVDTSKIEDENPTAVNKAIVELLESSERNSYVGFTATPFANVLMDPDVDQGLFPSDFIYALETPSNYYGATRFFDEDDGVVQETDDQHRSGLRIHTKMAGAEESFPFKHRSGWRLPASPPSPLLPASLERAIDTFIVATAIDDLSGHSRAPKSMLVNVSRYKSVQKQVYDRVVAHVEVTRKVIESHAPLGSDTSDLVRLKRAWEEEYKHLPFSWDQVRASLPAAVEELEVELVNGDTVKEREEAALRHRKWGSLDRRRLIAVGGTILSRGVTLERLLVSYFHQRTQLSDTLLQMGRWFGYRDGYDQLVRVWLDEEVRSWFAYTGRVVADLRREVVTMKALGQTPAQYGLRVRRHPEGLKITAANKMRHSETTTIDVAFYRTLLESTTLLAEEVGARRNVVAYGELFDDCRKLEHVSSVQRFNGAPQGGTTVFADVPVETILKFFETFRAGAEDQSFGVDMGTDGPAGIGFIRRKRNEFPRWDVAFVSGESDRMIEQCVDANVRATVRNKMERFAGPPESYRLANRRLLSATTLEQVARMTDNFDESRWRATQEADASRQTRLGQGSVPSYIDRPVLMVLRVVTKPESKRGVGKAADLDAGLVGAAVAFPEHPDGPDAEYSRNSHAEFVVNKVWLAERDRTSEDEE